MMGADVRLQLSMLRKEWPLNKALNGDDTVVHNGRIHLAAVLSRTDMSDKPLSEMWVTIEEAYMIGAACLSLRAKSLSEGGSKGYSNAYRVNSALFGFNALHARVRRRSMYVPILADEDTLIETIAYVIKPSNHSTNPEQFRLVQTIEKVRNLAFDHLSRFDWTPFGGEI
jgi:hypothetical protein